MYGQTLINSEKKTKEIKCLSCSSPNQPSLLLTSFPSTYPMHTSGFVGRKVCTPSVI